MVQLIHILLILSYSTASFSIFLPSPKTRTQEDIRVVETLFPAASQGWGWSSWTEWGGSCPSLCPRRCQRRGRYCRGICPTGKGTQLSNCPELEVMNNGTTEDLFPIENPFI